jgi:hypothetical protein
MLLAALFKEPTPYIGARKRGLAMVKKKRKKLLGVYPVE